MRRYLEESIKADLEEKMVFLGGSRQVGKTTIAFRLLGASGPGHRAYFNWDDVRRRKALLAGELPPEEGLIVFDEIHKFRRWRNWHGESH